MIGRRSFLTTAAAATLAGRAWSATRPPLPGHDLTGVWTNAWYTTLERRKVFTTLVIPEAQARAFEAPRRAHNGEVISGKDPIGQDESEFPDNGPGLARINGQARTSWIVDPPDGKIPWTKAGRARVHPDPSPPDDFDNVEARDTDERCLTAAGDGAPILNSHDANVLQIVQTPDRVLIVTEKNHAARIIEVLRPGAPAPPPGLPDWFGRSVGRWAGRTLVVETTGLRPGLTRLSDELSLSEHSKVTERFTRNGAGEIAYGFTVEDPSLFARPWRAEMVFRTAEGPMYEYACHEGNYSLLTILSSVGGPKAGAPATAQANAPAGATGASNLKRP